MKINSLGTPDQSLYHDMLFMAGISDTSQFPINDFIRSGNTWYRKGDSWVWEATGTWEFDDSNWSTLPIATGTLVDGQQDYTMPSSARKIDRVEVLSGEGDYFPVTPFDKSQIPGAALSEFYETNGFPKYYDLVGRSIMLYPKPAEGDVTMAAGIKVYYARDLDTFAITDTAQEPGFDSHFHRIISLGAAYDYFIRNGILEKQRQIRGEIEQLKVELQAHYGSRHRDMPTRLIPKDKDQI